MAKDAQELFSKLDGLGEDEVRLRLAQGVYGEQSKPLVREWIQRLERSRVGDFNDAQIESARLAARSARTAAITAVVAAVIAAISVIISIFK